MNSQAEASAVWRALEPKIRNLVSEMTRSCVQRKKMTVTELPNGTTIGVAEAYGVTIHIPYVSTLADVQVGRSVWVEYTYGLSNAVAVSVGAGTA